MALQMPRAFYANGMTLIWKEQFNTNGCVARRMSNQKLHGHNLGADLCQVLKGIQEGMTAGWYDTT
jgi:hypothetical protein